MQAAAAARNAKMRGEKAQEKQRKLDEEKSKAREELKSKAAKVFIDYDANKDQVLDKAEVTEYVKVVAKDASLEVTEAMVEMILQSVVGDRNGAVNGPDCQKLVKTTEATVRLAQTVSPRFDKHDKDQSGALTYDELIPLLRELLAEEAPNARMTAGDVLYLIAECDADGDMRLSHDELLPAVSIWIEVTKLLPADEDASNEAESDDAILAEVKEILEARAAQGEKVSAEDGVSLEQRKKEKELRHEQALKNRCHPLEGAKVVRKGMDKSKVRTMSGKHIVVENKELDAAAKAVAKRDKQKATAGADGKKKGSSMCALL